MRKQTWTAFALLFLSGVAALAGDNADRDKLFGTWVEADSGGASTWTFAGTGDSLHVTQLNGTAKVADFPCDANGKACQVKLSGKKAAVSMYFNGEKLVLTETRGSTVVKRRFAVLPQGDTMQLELIPLVPEGKTETIQFKRAQLSAQGK